jgi:hypothetical protein
MAIKTLQEQIMLPRAGLGIDDAEHRFLGGAAENAAER